MATVARQSDHKIVVSKRRNLSHADCTCIVREIGLHGNVHASVGRDSRDVSGDVETEKCSRRLPRGRLPAKCTFSSGCGPRHNLHVEVIPTKTVGTPVKSLAPPP